MTSIVPPIVCPPSLATDNVRTYRASSDATCECLLRRVAKDLAQRGETALLVMLFGRNAATRGWHEALREIPGAEDWPVFVAEGEPCGAGAMVGAQVFTWPVARAVERVRVGGRVVASVFDDGDARHCLVAMPPPVNSLRDTPAAQAEETFGALEKILGGAGFQIADVARTWFYNRDILAWYDDFNRVRNAYYGRRPFRSGATPASTGIEGRNPADAALALAAWAVRPVAREARVAPVVSPLQCPAPAYGSAFSRAMEIVSGGRTRLCVSGTASIAPGGASVWPGDAAKQIALTMDVIEAILRSRGLDFADVARASAYFKRAEDVPHFVRWLESRGLAGMPYLPMHCDVCRDELLFELELDACK